MLALPFLFPGYYTTWGRLTQISGMIVLPLLVGVLMAVRTMHSESEEPAGSSLRILVGTLLTAGLFLLHARVFFYFIPFGLVLGGFYLVRWWQAGRQIRINREAFTHGPLGQLTVIAILSGLLVAPRIWSLLTETTYIGVGVVQGAADRPLLSFPVGYVTAGWERWFWLIAGLALLLALTQRIIRSAARLDKTDANHWVKVSGILVVGLAYFI